ncbi:hypothetical protein BOTBODRAFT_105936 [Botryobasidium botryosum FD-172 SS1]|uniref:Catalase core domain-containing protein n=1 Tax=Botryobasidium botryosum (strain FD-172 SS1) TaxID=930990 RepID=A0A067N0J6_BOTB1|nr:hypothetical protein BOTBODRAFT_105936 [Botryobasidium botryosum FD-172 SS1]
MPLPSDERIVALSKELIAQFDAIFGLHPGFRPAHARGLLLSGTFTPTPEAAKLSSAPHFNRASTPVTARFSSSTGIPLIPDTDPNANPRGLGIRFNLADHVHTDIVAHSADGFPTRTGAEFLEFLHALVGSGPGVASPTPVEKFLGAHPGALAFVQLPKPFPSSFSREKFFGVTAFKFISSDGTTRHVRYIIDPHEGAHHLDDEAVKTKGPNFLYEGVEERLKQGPIRYQIKVQIANEGDVVDDATVHWPADRPLVELGQVELTTIVDENEKEQKRIIYDPIPRVEGIEPSEDPLLELRAAVYLISGRRRRAA